MNRLASKSAILTGGAVGIGRVGVIRTAQDGAKVAILDMLETEGKALAADLTANGHEAAFCPVDVADKAAIDGAAVRFGGLHVLVNNAGISGSPKPTDQMTEAERGRVQEVNVKGVFFGTKHAIPRLRATAPDLEGAKVAAGAAHPIGTMGDPDDIAGTVAWLALEEAKFVTVTEIVINGGYTAR